MIDRDRFRARVRELRALADRMTPLAAMPDRATGADLRLAADLAKKAADSLVELLEVPLPGCICRLIETDNYSYRDYAEGCQHHGSLFKQERQLKEDYQKMERSLKDEARMKIITAALTGTAVTTEDYGGKVRAVDRAIAIADEAIHRITETA